MSNNDFPSFEQLQELDDRQILCMIVQKLREISQSQTDHIKSHAAYNIALLVISVTVVSEVLLTLMTSLLK